MLNKWNKMHSILKHKYKHETYNKVIFYLLSVMVYIHGGSFTHGSGSVDVLGPERFLDFGVVSF